MTLQTATERMAWTIFLAGEAGERPSGALDAFADELLEEFRRRNAELDAKGA